MTIMASWGVGGGGGRGEVRGEPSLENIYFDVEAFLRVRKPHGANL